MFIVLGLRQFLTDEGAIQTSFQFKEVRKSGEGVVCFQFQVFTLKISEEGGVYFCFEQQTKLHGRVSILLLGCSILFPFQISQYCPLLCLYRGIFFQIKATQPQTEFLNLLAYTCTLDKCYFGVVNPPIPAQGAHLSYCIVQKRNNFESCER